MNTKIGRIILSTSTRVPIDASLLYADITFVARDHVPQMMTGSGLDALAQRINDVA